MRSNLRLVEKCDQPVEASILSWPAHYPDITPNTTELRLAADHARLLIRSHTAGAHGESVSALIAELNALLHPHAHATFENIARKNVIRLTLSAMGLRATQPDSAHRLSVAVFGIVEDVPRLTGTIPELKGYAKVLENLCF